MNSSSRIATLPSIQAGQKTKTFVTMLKKARMELMGKEAVKNKETQTKQYQYLDRRKINIDMPYNILASKRNSTQFEKHLYKKRHSSIKTLSNTQFTKKKFHTQNQPTKISQQEQLEDPEVQEMVKAFKKLPLKTKFRTEKSTKQVRNFLTNNNKFFNKLTPVITSCFIKVGKFYSIPKGKIIYEINQPLKAFYVILSGKVIILNPYLQFRKTCTSGETIGQEVLFHSPEIKQPLEIAKTHNRVHLLEITLENYFKICKQMLKLGYKTEFCEMESAIKRNYLAKKFARNHPRKSSCDK